MDELDKPSRYRFRPFKRVLFQDHCVVCSKKYKLQLRLDEGDIDEIVMWDMLERGWEMRPINGNPLLPALLCRECKINETDWV